jgi:NADH:ubiquinone oxidoreductase subunit F (NADH-binding)
VVVNGVEGEPQSLKDRVLMTTRPHLILDGALLAARTLHASEVVVCIREDHLAARAAMVRALGERPEAELRSARIVAAPARYVAGESSAVVNLIRLGNAAPMSNVSEPVLVQNVETLAHTALIARSGAEWYRSAGRSGAAGTVLLTIAGAVAATGVLEVEAGTTVREAIDLAGGVVGRPLAMLFGGYFGAWIPADEAKDLPLDGPMLSARSLSLGCGVIAILPDSRCGVCETARVMRYLAAESSAQCGPCFFGLRALADACGRIKDHGSNLEDLARLQRWAAEVTGRGACRHPDGAAIFLQSALRTFAAEFAQHPAHRRARTA